MRCKLSITYQRISKIDSLKNSLYCEIMLLIEYYQANLFIRPAYHWQYDNQDLQLN